MKTMRRDQDMVAWTKITLTFAVDPQPRRAGEEQDPFIMILIVWFICWRGLTGRDDPLDPHTLAQEELGDDLLVCPSGKVIEQIDHGRALLHPPQPRQVTAAAPVPAGPSARLFPKLNTLS